MENNQVTTLPLPNEQNSGKVLSKRKKVSIFCWILLIVLLLSDMIFPSLMRSLPKIFDFAIPVLMLIAIFTGVDNKKIF